MSIFSRLAIYSVTQMSSSVISTWTLCKASSPQPLAAANRASRKPCLLIFSQSSAAQQPTILPRVATARSPPRYSLYPSKWLISTKTKRRPTTALTTSKSRIQREASVTALPVKAIGSRVSMSLSSIKIRGITWRQPSHSESKTNWRLKSKVQQTSNTQRQKRQRNH